jgi:hypothetical protein
MICIYYLYVANAILHRLPLLLKSWAISEQLAGNFSSLECHHFVNEGSLSDLKQVLDKRVLILFLDTPLLIRVLIRECPKRECETGER